MRFLEKSSVLITGGTGSLGKEVTKFLLENTSASKIAIYSRDEVKQLQMRNQFDDDKRLRFFLGDIRDADRLKLALRNIDFVIHAAALKQVVTGEYNPMEFVKTNILGSQNVIDACMAAGVKKVIAVSTDKASSPINLYGATKLTADKLFIAANNISHSAGTFFSVVRYGNVMGSRGSVIPFFQELAVTGKGFPITDYRMTRFFIRIQEAVLFIIESLDMMNGGEMFVPKIPSMKIIDLANAINPKAHLTEVGIRPGEKLHEELISAEESNRTYLYDKRYTVLPVYAEWKLEPPKGVIVPENFSYKSDTNDLWLTIDQIKSILDDLDVYK